MEEIEPQDTIMECLRALGGQLTSFVGTGLLESGKCEKQLKLFLARAWMGVPRHPRRVCLMDKRFNGSEIDLLGLEHGMPEFWMETKCSFRQDPGDAKKSARSAVTQVITARLVLGAD